MKINLDNGACAFLKHNGKYLLLKRSPHKKLAPNVWSAVGGHLEQHEINNPAAACLREVEEETGITSEHIFNLELRYIIIRRYKDTIGQYYVYFGDTDTDKFVDTDEGKLSWIDEDQLLNREFSRTFEAMLKLHTTTPDAQKRVMVGMAENNNGKLKMNWSILEDFENK